MKVVVLKYFFCLFSCFISRHWENDTLCQNIHTVSTLDIEFWSANVLQQSNYHLGAIYMMPEWLTPVFIPNKILFLVRHFILVSCKLTENGKSCSLGVSGASLSDLAKKKKANEKRLRLSQLILLRECSTNFTLERNSFRKESYSGIK